MASADINVPQIMQLFTDSQIIFSEADIVDVIDEIRHNATPRPDKISPVLLINCRHSSTLFGIDHFPLALYLQSPCYKSSIITPLHEKRFPGDFLQIPAAH